VLGFFSSVPSPDPKNAMKRGDPVLPLEAVDRVAPGSRCARGDAVPRSSRLAGPVIGRRLRLGTLPIAESARGDDRARAAGKAHEEGDLEGAAALSLAGRVRRLWISEAVRVPGRVDSTSGSIARSGGDDTGEDDALDALVARVIERSGDVRVVEDGVVPAPGSWCLELR
jgi:hypothetical protein